MKPQVLFSIGVLSGIGLATMVSVYQHSKERALLEVDRAKWKQDLDALVGSSQRERENLRRENDRLHDQVAKAAREVSSSKPIAESNSALLTYLGEPLPVPQEIDPKYSAAALRATFQSLCQRHGVPIEKLGVDTSEFPFIVHGVVGSRRAFDKIGEDLRALGYDYGGMVTGTSSSGGTFFSLNLTGTKVLPKKYQEAVSRRMMVRLQMVSAAWME